PAERDQIIYEWNRTESPLPAGNVVELFEIQAKQHPARTALVFEGQTLSYGEVNFKANQLARYLQEKGAGKEDLVAVRMERCCEMVIALVAILKAGAAYVPLDPGYPEERLKYMLADAQARFLLTQAATPKPTAANFETICLEDWQRISRQSGANLGEGIAPEQLAYVIYTSGSTGKPKGAMNHHLGLHNRLWWMQQEYQIGPGDRVLQKTPFSFDVSVWEFFWPLLAGAQLVIARPEGHRDSA